MADPTTQQINDMQKRLGIRQTGNLEQTQKDLRDIVRLQPKASQKFLKMTKADYDLFGVEPSLHLEES